GASACSSRRQPVSGTSTHKTPSTNSTARVRAATALPHAKGQASSGACSGGAFFTDRATTLSSPAEAGCKEDFLDGMVEIACDCERGILASRARHFFHCVVFLSQELVGGNSLDTNLKASSLLSSVPSSCASSTAERISLKRGPGAYPAAIRSSPVISGAGRIVSTGMDASFSCANS